MTQHLVILRPEPGASATAARAEAAGWTAVKAPLFNVLPLAWTPPDPANFDAALMTSANAARHGGPDLARFAHLPLYAVGAKTAAAARESGFETVITGKGGVAETADGIRAKGLLRIFHPCGRETRPFDETGLEVAHVPVYAADAMTPPGLADALSGNAVILLHSPRAARAFSDFCEKAGIPRATLALVAISDAALIEAGSGWRRAIATDRPDDDAMLAAASSL
jgi:uroporphyrinogen-III synthase